ncbi:dihydrolipoamide acetyltransferase family protein [Conexibacter sp. JD483]|uniref:dihydrolipoamide acetyltransferase family protein n=1 Tax=unclassified Conexibacter TaxID=2627773 RepID=UPI002728A35B|nr:MULTISPECIES: dihydrolipoamide acetyltransferase family protein [unclassified Conexibacter]MDO8186988.1 dihydrolipoamide acetyltransferase family protein [Conexibacter sp. CPCC 205706]MDO8200694.1 dihydrolipoamide acetyltransferase family protein [Conexibacter sp. CPCC 205762]MDR9371481.1 dihydrolipoamide acetyltransferase family protein [Conexibacter sp. JD483]
MTSSRTEPRVLVDVAMPQMGVSVAEGTVSEWKLAVGDPVVAEETICEITTDKVDTELPAPASGVVAEILVPVGETVDVGTVLARIATAGAVVADAEPAPAARRYSPVVSRIAAEHQIDLSKVIGSGRDGRVRKQDVLALVSAKPAEEPPLHIESPYVPEEAPAGETLSPMRRQIGAHMKRSLETAATCTTWMECDMSRVEAARRQARVGDLIGITALPIVARATIEALRDFPALNATLDGERYRQHRAIHLGVAVSLGRDGGLIVPVIRDAQELSAEGLASRIKDVAQRARHGRLAPDEVHGGTFTITNPGQYGAIMATPVINQPQVAILDLEAIVKRPIVVSDDDGNDMISIRPQTILGLSWDHRALDGAQAAQFLAAIRRRLESWER